MAGGIREWIASNEGSFPGHPGGFPFEALLLSSLTLPGALDLPIFFDEDFIVHGAHPEQARSESEGVPLEIEAVLEDASKALGPGASPMELEPAYSRVIEVPRGAVPPSYDEEVAAYPYISFEPDVFQKQCFYYISRSESVFVTAHTSSGKTLIAEYAAYLASLHRTRVLYTSPIKALSNQKYREFASKFESVGIMTGDAQINSNASCVVMTTEILRNILYRSTDVLQDVEYIVFDEIHYLSDRERGVVWEEVIILLPRYITLVFLSATSPNAKDLSSWISETKQKDVYLIGTEGRAVALEHCLYFRRELFRLKEGGSFSHEEYVRAKKKGAAEVAKEKERERLQAGRPGKPIKVPHVQTKSAYVLDSPVTIIKDLVAQDLVPAVFFDFSKSRVEQAFSLCESLDLTTKQEKSAITDFVGASLRKLPEEDRELPQIRFIVPKLVRGFGVHHGGLLPIMKEVVEILFSTGAIRVLFATETFAMGLNMPTRTVVLRTLRKYSSEQRGHVDISTNEYIQMSGRAGRRGYDLRGTVVIENHGKEVMGEQALVRLLTGAPARIESRFYITFNMILKLVRAKSISVEDMIRLSFGETGVVREIRRCLREKKEIERELGRLESPLDCACRVDGREYVEDYLQFRRTVHEMYRMVVDHPELDYDFACRKVPRSKKELFFKGAYVADIYGRVHLVEGVSGDCQIHTRVLAPGAGRQDRTRDGARGEGAEQFIAYPLATHLDLDVASAQTKADPEGKGREAVLSLSQVLFISLDGASPIEMQSRNLDLSLKISEASALWKRLGARECGGCSKFREHYRSLCAASALERRASLIGSSIEHAKNTNLFVKNYFNYFEFLTEMEYIDKSSNLRLKGKVACEFNSVDCVMMTELLFGSSVLGLPADDLVAALSGLAFHEKKYLSMEEGAGGEMGHERRERAKRLGAAMEMLHEFAEQTHPVYERYRIPQEALNFAMVGELALWLEGYELKEILAGSVFSEGVIIKYVKKMVEVCTEIESAARIMGNEALGLEMERVSVKLKRGIMFAPSLYYS